MIKEFSLNSNSSDKQLIQAVQNKNETAFSLIYRKYYSDVLKHLEIKSISNSYMNSFLEEIATDTFVTLWENILNGKYESQGYLKAYLQKTAYFKFLKKTQKKQIYSLDKEISDEANEAEIHSILDSGKTDYLQVAENGLKELDEICLQIILLKYYEKLDDDTIFDLFPEQLKNVGNVRKRRSKCMDKLKRNCKLK